MALGKKRTSAASTRLARLYRMHDNINRDFFEGKLLPIRIKLEKRNVRNWGSYMHRIDKQDLCPEPEKSTIHIHVDCFKESRQLLGTLIHEMIHQWQAEVARIPCDHGLEFERMRKRAIKHYWVEV